MGLMGRNGGESAGSDMRERELVGSGGDGWELEDSGEAQQWSAAMRGDSTASPVVGEDNGPSRFPDTGGDPFYHTPPHAPTGAEGVGHFRVSPEGKSFAEMAGHFHQMFSFSVLVRNLFIAGSSAQVKFFLYLKTLRFFLHRLVISQPTAW